VTATEGTPAATRRIEAPPSMATLAADALRAMVLSGDMRPGDRVVENRLTAELGVSRPPLREAMRVLEQEGLIVQTPRRGAVVTPLTLHDVYEIFTLREELETAAIALGVPVRSPERLDRCRRAVEALEQAAREEDPARVTALGFDFHVAVVGLAGHRRLEDAYRSLSLQMRLCMAMNRRARKSRETLHGDAARHRRILDLAERGDTAAVQHALRHHGHRTFLLDAGDTFEGHSPESETWLAEVCAGERARAEPTRPEEDT
jgi:DNA-binding GntR family transcriptional regulator